MDVVETAISAVKLLTTRKFGDDRGFFSEIYNQRTFATAGVTLDFVQDNYAYTGAAGVIRGLHYQTAPFAQDKLVRVTRGAILDVAVDIRRDSPTFGQHVTMRLSADGWTWALVPIGFAHGYCTLEPNTEVLYKVTNFYSPAHDRGLLWSDPDLGIDWPVTPDTASVSTKDQVLPRFSDLTDFF